MKRVRFYPAAYRPGWFVCWCLHFMGAAFFFCLAFFFFFFFGLSAIPVVMAFFVLVF